MLLRPLRYTLFPYTTLFRSFEELGRGGMGVVSRAEQQSLSREVAVKTAHEEEPVKARALIREARIMGSLERSEEHTSELQSRVDLVCRLLLEKKKKNLIKNA